MSESILQQVVRPSWRKVVIASLVILLMPSPLYYYYCFQGNCGWALWWKHEFVIIGLYALLYGYGTLFVMLTEFLLYWLVVYTGVSLIEVYLGDAIRPSRQKIIITSVITFLLPFPIYLCNPHCGWELMWMANLVSPGLSALSYEIFPIWLATCFQFLLYWFLIYVGVSLILRRTGNQ